MNRKGQLALILLPIVALVFAGVALFSFVSFKGGFENQSGQISSILSDIEIGEAYVFSIISISAKEVIESKSSNLKEDFKKSVAKKDLMIVHSGNFFGLIRSEDFEFYKSGENYFLKVTGVSLFSKSGFNSIKRNFDLEIEFNSQGDISNKLKKFN